MKIFLKAVVEAKQDEQDEIYESTSFQLAAVSAKQEVSHAKAIIWENSNTK